MGGWESKSNSEPVVARARAADVADAAARSITTGGSGDGVPELFARVAIVLKIFRK